MKIVLIAVGGAAGTLCRYGVALAGKQLTQWPLGTLVVNVVGCFVLAFLSELLARGVKISDELRLAVSVGFCGGLTTYSTFNQDALLMIRAGEPLAGALYLVITLVLCACASLLGVVVARSLSPGVTV